MAAFVLHTDATLKDVVERLDEVAKKNPGGLEDLERQLGFNWNPEWLLLDADLDFKTSSVFMWDCMTCYCTDGVVVKAVNAFMQALKKVGLGMEKLDQFLHLWQWPKIYDGAQKICRHHGDGKTRDQCNGSSSEFLSLVPVLYTYVNDVVQPKRSFTQPCGQHADYRGWKHN